MGSLPLPINNVIDPVKVLAELASDEKANLLSGGDRWHSCAIPRLGVPPVRVSDGPNGVRGIVFMGGVPASCFPAATALGASFDTELVTRIGVALGAECRARGVHCLLGPTTNIQRSPLGGRGFESYAEDPFLSGSMGKAWIDGVQSRKVIVTPKHFVANEQEHRRFTTNSVIDERTLHEIYLEPFRIQMKANPTGFMSSYNRVNGTHVAESRLLLRKILREQWGFKGMVMSDWSGVYSSSEGVKAGCDLEMPGPSIMRGVRLERDMMSGKLDMADIDDCVLRVLNFVKEAQLSGIPFDAEEKSIDTPEVRALLLESAREGVVLLKNTKGILPIKATQGTKIAVIGPNANEAYYSGGGSARLPATYTVTPLEGMKAAAEKVGATVSFAAGADTNRWSNLLSKYLRVPGTTETGVHLSWFDKNPHAGEKVAPVFSKTSPVSYMYFVDGIPAFVPVRSWLVLRATFIPDVSGPWEFGLGVCGQADLYIDGKQIVKNSENQKAGLLFFTSGAEEQYGRADLIAGQEYALEVRFTNFRQINLKSPYAGRRGGIRIGGAPVTEASNLISEAVALAKSSDVSILVVGTTDEWESESYDRADLKLPEGTDELITAVLAANPNTVIVNQSGMPCEFPWLSNCSALLQAFFGGNEAGAAISDAIFGVHNPSGKLPVTFPRALEDHPSVGNFGDDINTVYAEGVKVGYRYFDRPGAKRSAFPFGFGLSYTTFKYTNLVLESLPAYGIKVTFTITNTGAVAGSESAQVYVHDTESIVERPEIELKGFTKVKLEPGQSKTVSVELDHTALSFYSVDEKAWVAEKGTFEIRIAPSSVQTALSAPFVLKENFKWIGLNPPTKCELY